jgi:hypothetical protein
VTGDCIADRVIGWAWSYGWMRGPRRLPAESSGRSLRAHLVPQLQTTGRGLVAGGRGLRLARIDGSEPACSMRGLALTWGQNWIRRVLRCEESRLCGKRPLLAGNRRVFSQYQCVLVRSSRQQAPCDGLSLTPRASHWLQGHVAKHVEEERLTCYLHAQPLGSIGC